MVLAEVILEGLDVKEALSLVEGTRWRCKSLDGFLKLGKIGTHDLFNLLPLKGLMRILRQFKMQLFIKFCAN